MTLALPPALHRRDDVAQIHHTRVGYEDRWVLDPAMGAVKRREEILQPSGVERIVHGDETYEIQDDLSFQVSDAAAAHLVSQPGWHYGPSPFAPVVEAAPKPKAAVKPKA